MSFPGRQGLENFALAKVLFVTVHAFRILDSGRGPLGLLVSLTVSRHSQRVARHRKASALLAIGSNVPCFSVSLLTLGVSVDPKTSARD